MTDQTRRRLLFMPLAALLLALHTHGVMADDGESGGGNSGSGGEDDDGDHGGGGNSGSGGDDDDDDDDGGNLASGGNSEHSRDHDRARDAVRRGKAVSLKTLKQHLAEHYPGKVVKIELKRRSGELVYKVRILDSQGRLNTYRLDARNLARSRM